MVDPFRSPGSAPQEISDFSVEFGDVEACFRPLPWGVPSSYWDYQGNLGFFCGIFRDITPIAAQ
jgi:hypothetical protein